MRLYARRLGIGRGARHLTRGNRRGSSRHNERDCQCDRPSYHRHQYTLAHPEQPHSSARLNLSAFPMTDTELKLIAAAAIMGERSNPNTGYSTPAATGTPAVL